MEDGVPCHTCTHAALPEAAERELLLKLVALGWRAGDTQPDAHRFPFEGTDFPFIALELPEHPKNHNAHLPEDDYDALHAIDTPLLVPPDTNPGDYVPRAIPRWTGTDAALPQHPRLVYFDHGTAARPGPWQRKCRWGAELLAMVKEAYAAAVRHEKHVVRYARLEGGRHGMVIMAADRHERWRHLHFDVAEWERRGERPPLRPRVAPPPSERTDWNLLALLAHAARRAHSGQGPVDMQMPWEVAFHGCDNRSTAPLNEQFIPPYPPFWDPENLVFALQKFAEKLDPLHERFDKPRLLGPTKYFQTLPAQHPAITVARNLAGKPRVAVDLGSSREHGADGKRGWVADWRKQPGPLSCNAWEDKKDVAPFDFMPIMALMRRADIMLQARRSAVLAIVRATMVAATPPPGLLLEVLVEDKAAWYEQCGAAPINDWMKNIGVAWVPDDMLPPGSAPDPDRGACALDVRTTFGDRLAAFLTYLLTMQGTEEVRWRERQARARALRDSRVPAASLRFLLVWMAAREAIGSEPAWIEAGAFFDDCQYLFFAFFRATTFEIVFGVWKDWNFDVADGTRHRKMKTEHTVEPKCPTILGALPDLGQRCMAVPDPKLDSLDALLDAIELQRHRKIGVEVALILRFRGRTGHMAEFKPTMKGDLQVSYELKMKARCAVTGSRQPAYERYSPVDDEAMERMRQIARRARHDRGAAFMPRTGTLGKNSRGVLHCGTDASCAVDKTSDGRDPLDGSMFFGYGCWAWIEGTSFVLITQDYLTPNTRNSLRDSTAVELVASNELVIWVAPLLQLLETDMMNVTDSTSSKGICMGGRSRGAAERELYAQRCASLDRLAQTAPDAAVITHAVRRGRGKEADLLSRCVVCQDHPAGFSREPEAEDELIELFSARFGRPMQLVFKEPPEGGAQRLTAVLRRHERSAKTAVRICEKARRKLQAARQGRQAAPEPA